MRNINIRIASIHDIDDILSIYNEGIEDRIATLETSIKDKDFMLAWFHRHTGRFKVIIAEVEGEIVGWASLNQYNSRSAYDGVADLSVYVRRDDRGRGIGGKLLSTVEKLAKENVFHKIVLFTFPFNELGQGLYKKSGFREVGVFKKQGKIDDQFIDVMAMEKLLV
ncbi:arsinothricin resistance N-acetyltransferase ArsN1 family A [Fredinandcohnia onubensis]|uniref:arsinothricin resistance N-acetyltransferase ArsN1 family A n=1 Tax=Fredinandcohnia onubensis TaxID=1571209 RepID=UPI000C0BDA29|nr:arsinothricin resistance N-acetyltransferase ArsN1 family A [Fredinandcohnia onubensis]